MSSRNIPVITSDVSHDVRLFADRVRERMVDLGKLEQDFAAVKNGEADILVRATSGRRMALRRVFAQLSELQTMVESLDERVTALEP